MILLQQGAPSVSAPRLSATASLAQASGHTCPTRWLMDPGHMPLDLSNKTGAGCPMCEPMCPVLWQILPLGGWAEGRDVGEVTSRASGNQDQALGAPASQGQWGGVPRPSA